LRLSVWLADTEARAYPSPVTTVTTSSQHDAPPAGQFLCAKEILSSAWTSANPVIFVVKELCDFSASSLTGEKKCQNHRWLC
jgi:hypothetical protein